MNEIIGVITSVEDDEYPVGKTFKKVTLGTGQVLKVKHGRDDALKAKWGLLKEGAAIKFTMQDFTKTDGVKIPFVYDIETVESQLPPSKEPEPLLKEHQEIVDKAVAYAETAPLPAKKERNPQEVGLAYKILSELYVNGFIDENKPDGKELIMRLKMWLKEVLLNKE